MSSTASAPARPRSSVARTTVVLVATVAAAVAVNSVIAAIAVATGASSSFPPLTFPAYTTFTALGLVLGWVGWLLVSRRAREPRRTLAVLVPVVTVLSFVPDVLLLTLQFIPGTTPAAVVGLMGMHIATVAVGVLGYAIARPPRG